MIMGNLCFDDSTVSSCLAMRDHQAAGSDAGWKEEKMEW